jgi:peroxiredoxin Q/BCP
VKAHCSFTEKHGLRIPLLSDPDATVIRTAGAWGEKQLRGRTYEGIIRSTLVVDRDGLVLLSYPVVKPQGHATAVYKDLRKL